MPKKSSSLPKRLLGTFIPLGFLHDLKVVERREEDLNVIAVRLLK